MIGNKLTELLIASGHSVGHLNRTATTNGGIPTFHWDPLNGEIDDKSLQGVEVIIHLAGAGIADERWTKDRKKEIIDSRVKGAQMLFDACKRKDIMLKNFISSSAVGWYPLIISDNRYDESSPPGTGFLAEVCQAWEKSADQFEEVAQVVTKLRVGLVLSKDGGVLSQIARPIRFYAGATLGSGRQYMSWVHISDVCGMFKHVMENNLGGVYNAVGPEPMKNAEFIQTIADVMDKPILLPRIPEFILRTIFGESANLVIKGVPISSKKIHSTGYEFDFPTLNSALFNIYW